MHYITNNDVFQVWERFVPFAFGKTSDINYGGNKPPKNGEDDYKIIGECMGEQNSYLRNAAMDEELCEKFTRLLHTNGFDKMMGFEVSYVEPGYTEILFYVHPEYHSNSRGRAHGGAIVGFSDTALGAACFSLGKAVNTIDINGNYLSFVKAGTSILAKSRVIHNGKTTMVAEVEIYDEKNKLVYSGRGTFFVREPFDLHG